MINLLPPQEKQKLQLEDQKRLVVVLSFALIIPLICFIMLQGSMALYLLGEIKSQKFNLAQAKAQYQTPDFLKFKAVIQDSNRAMAKLQAFYAREIYINDVLKTISTLPMPAGLYLTDLFLVRGTEKIKISATGFAKSREDLLTFQKSLQADKNIKNPTFSPQSWVAPQNTTFYLTFEIFK